MNPQNTQPVAAEIKNPLSVMQPDESVICEIKRHPIGIVMLYVGSGLLLVLIAIVLFAVMPSVVTTVNSTALTSISFVIFLATCLLTLGFVFIANKVYWGNRWILTSDSLTQITQNSLFDRQSSQLSLGNLEDITAEQNGIVAHMFKYGVLRAETAGEKSKFVFIYCPNPDSYAQQILNAREQFEQSFRTNGH
jgi:hypothetical protein